MKNEQEFFHDLMNQVAVVQGIASSLLNKTKKQDLPKEKTQQELERVVASLDKITDLIRDQQAPPEADLIG